jgi:hypothetical protein
MRESLSKWGGGHEREMEEEMMEYGAGKGHDWVAKYKIHCKKG